MGTTSTYFGGSGGGGATLDALNLAIHKNIDFAVNTQFSVSPTDQRGATPRIIPCASDTFWLLEGNSTSNVYISFWSLDDTGAATQQASPVMINQYADEVQSASSNGIDRAILVVMSGSDRFLFSAYYNGSSISISTITSGSQTFGPTSTCTCTTDGILMGVVSTNSGDILSSRIGMILPDGTTTSSTRNISMRRDNFSRFIGVGQGLVGLGRHQSNSAEMYAAKIYPKYDNSSSLVAISHQEYLQRRQGFTFDNRPPYLMPTSGGVAGAIVDANGRTSRHSITTYGDVVNVQFLDGNRPSSQGSDVGSDIYNEALGNEHTFARQSNGTYINWASNHANYITFDPVNTSHHAPYGNIRPIGDAQSSGCSTRTSTAIVGNFVLASWYDETNGEVNIDAWNFRG